MKESPKSPKTEGRKPSSRDDKAKADSPSSSRTNAETTSKREDHHVSSYPSGFIDIDTTCLQSESEMSVLIDDELPKQRRKEKSSEKVSTISSYIIHDNASPLTQRGRFRILQRKAYVLEFLHA